MKKILVTGCRGMLGTELMRKLGDRCSGVDLPEVDVSVMDSVNAALERYKPEVIINAAAVTDVDFCESSPSVAEKVHCTGVENLCSSGARVITLSTDHVFKDGKGAPLLESSRTDPANQYARGKLKGEQIALRIPGNCVVRTSWLFGERGMLPRFLAELSAGGKVQAVADQTACITSAENLADVIVRMAFDETMSGLYHCVNPGAVSPFTLACRLQIRLGRGKVTPILWNSLGLAAPRPVWSVLGTERSVRLPPLEEAMESCVKKVL